MLRNSIGPSWRDSVVFVKAPGGRIANQTWSVPVY
jgi:hypothetical protein